MKVIVKTQVGLDQPPESVVASSVGNVAPESIRGQLVVSRVFPKNATGHRSRMVSIAVPDGTPGPVVEALVSALSKDVRLEYVQVPAVKKLL